jgi:hypothetical protein
VMVDDIGAAGHDMASEVGRRADPPGPGSVIGVEIQALAGLAPALPGVGREELNLVAGLGEGPGQGKD